MNRVTARAQTFCFVLSVFSNSNNNLNQVGINASTKEEAWVSFPWIWDEDWEGAKAGEDSTRHFECGIKIL